MELTKIDHVPEFKTDVSELVRSKMTEENALLADTLSIIRQQGEWSCRISMEAYNLGVENAIWKQRLLMGIVGVVFSAGVGAFFAILLK